jgi:hypothetical protein
MGGRSLKVCLTKNCSNLKYRAMKKWGGKIQFMILVGVDILRAFFTHFDSRNLDFYGVHCFRQVIKILEI